MDERYARAQPESASAKLVMNMVVSCASLFILVQKVPPTDLVATVQEGIGLVLPSFFPFTSCIINVVVGIEYHSTPLICRHLTYDHPSCFNGTRAPDGEKGVCWRELGCSREEIPDGCRYTSS